MGSGEAAQLASVLVSGMGGLLVGSFLNVAVYRLPLGMSVVEPPSHCPSCAARLTLVDLVPVLSWLWLRARCRHCGAPISWRYPLVELATGVLCAATAAVLGSVWPLPSVAVVVVCAFAAAIVDTDGGDAPLAFALVGALAAASLLPIAVAIGHADRLVWAAIGALLGLLGALGATAVLDGARARTRTRSGPGSSRPRHPTGVTLLVSLAWAAGWLWTGGGALVAAWIVAAAVAGRRARRAPFAVLAAGSVVGVLVSALISRP